MLSKLWQFLNINQLKTKLTKDPFVIIRFLGIDFLNITFLRYFIIFTLFVQGVATAAYLITLLITFDSVILLKFGPFAFITLTAIAGIVISVYYKDLTITIVLEQISIIQSFGEINEKILTKIRREAKVISVLAILNIFVGIAAIIHYFPIGGQKGADLHFGIYYIEQMSNPKVSFLLSLLFYASLLPGTYALFIFAFSFISLLSYMKYHLYIINDMFEVDQNYSRNKFSYLLLKNKTYQNNVNKKLKSYIQHHQTYKRIESKIIKTTSTLLLIMTYSSILTYFSMIINFFEEEGFMKYTRIGSVTLTVLITTELCVRLGQSLIDEYLLISKHITDLHWVSWNLKNRKLMLIFLINTQKPPIFGVPGLCTCDYAFVITAIKFIMSVATFLVEIVPRKN